MFRIHPTFFDLIAILLSVFMLISVLMAQNIQQEYLTKVDMLKKAVENKNTDGPNTDPLSLTVILKGEEKDEFMLDDAEWQLLKEVIEEPTGGYNPAVVTKLVSFLIAVTQAV